MNKNKQIYDHHKKTMGIIMEMITKNKELEVKECVECGYFAPCDCELK